MTRNRLLVIVGLLTISKSLATRAVAQVGRYDLGQRLRAFERAWDETPDPVSRQRAVPLLNQAVRSFFSLNEVKVGESLDRATHLLRSADGASDAQRWADSLTFRPKIRFVDLSVGELQIECRELYATGLPKPTGAQVAVRLGSGPEARHDLGDLPFSFRVPVDQTPPGDHVLICQVSVAGQVLADRRCLISLAHQIEQRLETLRAATEMRATAESIETATLRYLVRLLSDLRSGQTFETDYPAAVLLEQAEKILLAITKNERHFQSDRSGEFWLRVPVGRTTETVRFYAPKVGAEAARRPIVAALHGAGASENMFFDSYGNGITLKECQSRGWYLVAPRAGGGFGVGGVPNVLAILEELAKRYPIDLKRVYLVGHSMGAGHALTLSQQAADRFAGVAALGGGGMIRKTEAFRQLPLFVGLGKDDFLIGAPERFGANLKKAGIPRLEVKIYPNVEHMMIVREAIPDVFRFWTTGAN